MLSRLAGLALSLSVGLAGCATLNAADIARAQRMNQFSQEMAMQSFQSAQLANDLLIQAAILNATLLAATPPPMPPPMP